jgi:hypothetical protein
MLLLMLALCKLIFGTMIDLLRSRATLEAEIVVLRQQINVLRRASPKRVSRRLGRCSLRDRQAAFQIVFQRLLPA